MNLKKAIGIALLAIAGLIFASGIKKPLSYIWKHAYGSHADMSVGISDYYGYGYLKIGYTYSVYVDWDNKDWEYGSVPPRRHLKVYVDGAGYSMDKKCDVWKSYGGRVCSFDITPRSSGDLCIIMKVYDESDRYLETLRVCYDVKGSAYETCTDECDYSGQTNYYCSGNSVYKKVCGNYDSDSCLEWSSGYFVKNCDNQDGWYCRDTYTREYRDYYCSGGSCKYTVTKTEKCPTGYKCVNGECKPVSDVVRCSSRSDLSVSIVSITPSKDRYEPGEEVTVKVRIKNNRNYKIKTLVEVGAIPYSLAVKWGIISGGTSILLPLATISEGACCKGQVNFDDKWITLEPNEEYTVEFKVKLPYEGIKDLCFDNKYWTGEGDYVIYVGAFDQCYNPQTGHKICSNFDTKTIKIEKEKPKPIISEWEVKIDIIKAATASILAIAGLALLLSP